MGKKIVLGVCVLALLAVTLVAAVSVMFTGTAQSQGACYTPQLSQDTIMAAAESGSNTDSVGGASEEQAVLEVPIPLKKLDAEQTGIAERIIAIGKQRGRSGRDILIALMTAMQESGMRNLNYGDRDSQGVFQQRPSQGWGTLEQVTNVTYATNKFYSVLEKIENRDSMRLTEAAQAVQRSAFPEAYAKHERLARAVLAAYGDTSLAVTTDLVTAGNPYCTVGFTAIDAAIQAAEGKVGSEPETPDGGSDPAGTSLVVWAYHTAGITVGTDAAEQLEDGVGVDDRRDLTRGDLLYFGSGNTATSVAMYIDDETVIGVDSEEVVSEFTPPWKRYIGAVRPVPIPYQAITVGYSGDASAGGWSVPIQGSYTISSPYGPRAPVRTPNGVTSDYHDGVDLSAPEGRPILAAASGVIVSMPTLTTSYGWHVVIDHGGGIVTLYAHMSGFATGLGVGSAVNAGQVIGYVGETGNANGSHLHFVVRVNGSHTAPIPFMNNHGVVIA